MGWLGSWAKRVKITIDNTDITSALSDFPVLIYLSSSSGRNNDDITFVFDEVGANSKKIAMTTSDGTTQLYVEIENWDNGTEVAWLWVKVTSVASASDTILYLYYDNSQPDNTTYVGDPESSAGEQVWNSNFKMVQHMTDYDTSNVHDSTSNDNDGVKVGANEPIEATGQIYKGQDCDGSNDYIQVGDDAAWQFTDNFTVEIWVKPNEDWDTRANDASLISANTGIGSNSGWGMKIDCDTTDEVQFSIYDGSWHSVRGVKNDWNSGQWYYICAVQTDPNTIIYIDGALDESNANNFNPTDPSQLNIGAWWIGEYPDAVIDEVRISNTDRSAAWIKATYETGIDDLLDYGSEEILAAKRFIGPELVKDDLLLDGMYVT